MNKIFHRRHLPHLYFNEGKYFITARIYDRDAFLRLNDSKLKNINELKIDDFRNQFIRYDRHLDKEKLKSYFNDEGITKLLIDCIHSLDEKEYKLIAYTIMPNHFHLLIELLPENRGLSKIMQLIKGRSAFHINKRLNLSGKFWQDESYDRWVRDDVELYFIIKYILLNPVQAGLAENWEDWQFTYCKKEFIVL